MSKNLTPKAESNNSRFFSLSMHFNGAAVVTLDSRFSVYPPELTSLNAKPIEVEYSDRHIIRSDQPIDFKTYDIWTMEWAWPDSAVWPLFNGQLGTHCHIGLANLMSLDTFRRTTLKIVKVDESTWVRLIPNAPIKNPHFNLLHATRVDDIGWGFYQDGCVSLSLAKNTGINVHRSTVYVQKNVQVYWKGLEVRSAVGQGGGWKTQRTH